MNQVTQTGPHSVTKYEMPLYLCVLILLAVSRYYHTSGTHSKPLSGLCTLNIIYQV